MRIDPKAISPGTTSLEGTERAESDKRTGRGGGASRAGGDSIQLSSDAQLLHSALKAAGELPTTRAERVEEVRRKLAAGELGQDLGRLADRLIDDVLERG